MDRAMELTLQSQSACNRQPFFFHFFDAPELLQKVGRIPIRTNGYADNSPVMAVLVGRHRAYVNPRDRHLITSTAPWRRCRSCTHWRSRGSTCPINWSEVEHEEKEMSEFLSLALDERPIMCLGVGYADPGGMMAFSQKNTLYDPRSYYFGLEYPPSGGSEHDQ